MSSKEIGYIWLDDSARGDDSARDDDSARGDSSLAFAEHNLQPGTESNKFPAVRSEPSSETDSSSDPIAVKKSSNKLQN